MLPSFLSFTLILVLLVFSIIFYFYSKGNERGDNIRMITSYNIKTLWKNRLSLLFLIILYYVFWNSGQGKDILVNINTNPWRVIQLFVGLTIFAILNWYIPRIVYEDNIIGYRSFRKDRSELRKKIKELEEDLKAVDTNDVQHQNTLKNELKKLREELSQLKFTFIHHYKDVIDYNKCKDEAEKKKLKYTSSIERRVARMIGTAPIFIVAGAVLNIHQQDADNYLAYLYFMSLILLAIASTNHVELNNFILRVNQQNALIRWLKSTYRYIQKNRNWLNYTYIILILLFIGLFGILNKGKLKGLLYLSFSLGFYGFLFLYLVSVRRKDFFKANKLYQFFKTGFYTIDKRFLKKRFTSYNKVEGLLILRGIKLLSVIVMAIVLIFNLFIPEKAAFSPTSVVLFSLCFYFIIFMVVDFYSKIFKVPFFLVGIIVVILLNVSGSSQDDIATTSKDKEYTERTSFEDHLEGWLKHNKDSIDIFKKRNGGKNYPVFLILGEGGGSRGGFWSLHVMSQLFDATDGKIYDHCLAMTGASGGQVGLTMFNSIIDDDKNLESIMVDSIFKKDFISPSLLLTLGRDFWLSLLPTKRKLASNRAELVEKQWKDAISEVTGDRVRFDESFLSHWYTGNETDKYDTPLLFINSTSVERGSRGIISPVKMDGLFSNAVDIIQLIETRNSDKTIQRNTAALLGARFPYVVPSGKVADGEHYTDAGYFDNIGGVTGLEIYSKCKELQRDTVNPIQGIKDVEFYFIVLRNDIHNLLQKKDKKIPPDISELYVPLNTSFATRSGHTDYSYQKIKDLMGKNFISFDVQHPENIIIPLSRYMSEEVIDEMKKSYNDSINQVPKDKLYNLLGINHSK